MHTPAISTAYPFSGVSQLHRVGSVGLIFLLAMLLGITGCGKDNSAKENPAKRSADQGQQVAQAKLRPIIIKGFYIGMTRDEVSEAVQNKLGPAWRVYKGRDPNAIEIITDALNPLMAKGDYAVNVILDASGHANVIYFGPNVSKIIFQSDQMNDEQFVQSVVDAYHVPKMNWTKNENGVSLWEYVSPDNVRVRVTPRKEISLEKVADRKELQGNFN